MAQSMMKSAQINQAMRRDIVWNQHGIVYQTIKVSVFSIHSMLSSDMWQELMSMISQ